MMVVRRKTQGAGRGWEGGSGKRGRRGETHSHLSSNYTTTLITLGLELIAGSSALLLLRVALLLQQSLNSCLLWPDNNSYRIWQSLSAPEIRPQGLSKVHIGLKAEQRRGGKKKKKNIYTQAKATKELGCECVYVHTS